ncbi:MAG: hypothetical protein CMK49_01635 [Prochlorococcus sp. SP3034]|nr:hypothetical protein [Prochlorococcus sp. SP3034]|tara:strand:- start:7373 stop:7924 length:552 start_codon:yes stop_codon:yes gene_type:complete
MISSRRNIRNNLEKINLEEKVDHFIEVGRQFVDGVSGARPGRRRTSSFKGISRRNVNNVTKWVNDKVDSFFEDEEDDWDYQLEKELVDNKKNFTRYDNSSKDCNKSKKRPLTAKSLRSSYEDFQNETKRLKSSDESWPEDKDFQINRWKRTSLEAEPLNLHSKDNLISKNRVRNLPKSSRRRI